MKGDPASVARHEENAKRLLDHIEKDLRRCFAMAEKGNLDIDGAVKRIIGDIAGWESSLRDTMAAAITDKVRLQATADVTKAFNDAGFKPR